MSETTTTPNYGLLKPNVNADNDLWGDHWNQNADTLDTIIKSVESAGVVTFNTRAGTVSLTTADVTTVLPPAVGLPAMDSGGGAPGVSPTWARGDHVHPTDTTRAPLVSPALTGTPTAPTAAPGTSTTQLATTAFVATSVGAVPGGAVVADTPPVSNPGALWWDSAGGQLYVRYDDGVGAPQWVAATNLASFAAQAGANNVGRNLLHNPLFNVAQRGNGPANGVIGSWVYGPDRWSLLVAAAGDTANTFLNTASPTDRTQIGDDAVVAILTTTFTGGGGAGNACILQQPIEGVRRLGGKTVTVSFWAIANTAALKLGVSLPQSFGTGGSPSPYLAGVGQSVTLATGWQRFSLTFVVPATTNKAVGAAGNDNTGLQFWFSSGTTNAIPAGNVGVQSGVITLWGVQLEVTQPGQTQPTPLEKPDPQQDLAKCQRFFQMGQFNQTSHCSVAGAPMNVSALAPVPLRSTSVVFAITGGGNINVGATTLSYNGYSIGATALMTAIGPCAINTVYTASADL